MDTRSVPTVWKTSTIIPLPKSTRAKEMQDFRPIALTPILSKCMERVISYHLKLALQGQLDPLQFAYRAKRGVEDASLTLMHTVTKHLDKPKSLVRVLFMDFSSAFNTVNINILLTRLTQFGVNSVIIHWLEAFLHNRPQRVKVNNIMSDSLTLNTGLPQGCILSPLLFSVYTNGITYNTEHLTLIKYADDMALIARLTDSHSVSYYIDSITELVRWFEDSHLQLNVNKTKELCFGSQKVQDPADSRFQPLSLNGQQVEQVDSFKYLGTIMDKSLNFNDHIECIYKNAQQRLFLLRQLKSFEVSACVLTRVYQSLIESVLTFNIVSWFGHLGVRDKTKLNRVVKQGNKITGQAQTSLTAHYSKAVCRVSHKIIEDKSHPLSCHFELLPSGRRYRAVYGNKLVYRNSFVPYAIKVLNQP